MRHRGHAVFVAGRRAAKMSEAGARIGAGYVVGDVLNARLLIRHTCKCLDGLDVVINCAAIFNGQPDEVLSTNVQGAYMSAVGAIEAGASIVILFSGAGVGGPSPGLNAPIVYTSAKAAVVQMAECFAREYPKLRINAVAPGPVSTQLTNWSGGSPDRAVDLVEWLCSDAASHVSGRLISVRDDYKAARMSDDFGRLRRVDA
jgi:NAD(P)-dependent dehydrogenase (short-subunit alcohol dehydrogenase family)